MAGLYFHIPFCASRCIYCGFYSTITPHAEKANTMDLYVDALCKEAITEKNYLSENILTLLNALKLFTLEVVHHRNCRLATLRRYSAVLPITMPTEC